MVHFLQANSGYASPYRLDRNQIRDHGFCKRYSLSSVFIKRNGLYIVFITQIIITSRDTKEIFGFIFSTR